MIDNICKSDPNKNVKSDH